MMFQTERPAFSAEACEREMNLAEQLSAASIKI
jgi:hypothetical protein